MDIKCLQVMIGGSPYSPTTKQSGGFDRVAQGAALLVRLAEPEQESYMYIGSRGVFKFRPKNVLTTFVASLDSATEVDAWALDLDGNIYLLQEGLMIRGSERTRKLLRKHGYDPVEVFWQDEFAEEDTESYDLEAILPAP
jgi:hypothetical protein